MGQRRGNQGAFRPKAVRPWPVVNLAGLVDRSLSVRSGAIGALPESRWLLSPPAPSTTASLATGFGTVAYVTIQRNNPIPIAIGTSNHNQRQLPGADVSGEGVGPGSYTRSSPRSIEVSSIVPTTYQARRLGKEDKVTACASGLAARCCLRVARGS